MSGDHKTRARAAIDIDPMGLAAELVGEGSPAFSAVSYLMVKAAAEEQKTSLSELCDTYYRMPWAECLEVLKGAGFIELARHEVSDGYRIEEHIIAAHPQRKLIASANSSTIEGERVLDYTLYLSGAADDEGDPVRREAIYQTNGSIHPVGDTAYLLDYHATVGLNLMLEEFDRLGVQFCDWPADKMFARDKLQGVADLPQWVKDFTGV